MSRVLISTYCIETYSWLLLLLLLPICFCRAHSNHPHFFFFPSILALAAATPFRPVQSSLWSFPSNLSFLLFSFSNNNQRKQKKTEIKSETTKKKTWRALLSRILENRRLYTRARPTTMTRAGPINTRISSRVRLVVLPIGWHQPTKDSRFSFFFCFLLLLLFELFGFEVTTTTVSSFHPIFDNRWIDSVLTRCFLGQRWCVDGMPSCV